MRTMSRLREARPRAHLTRRAVSTSGLACQPLVVGRRDLPSLLLGDRPRTGVTVQRQRVDGRAVGEADPVVVLRLLVRLSDLFDVLSRRDTVRGRLQGARERRSSLPESRYPRRLADVAQLVERRLPKP